MKNLLFILMVGLFMEVMFTNTLLAQEDLPETDISGWCYQKMGASNVGLGLNVFSFEEDEMYGLGISGGVSFFESATVADASIHGLYRLNTIEKNQKYYTQFIGLGVGYLNIEIKDSNYDTESYGTIIFSPMVAYDFGGILVTFKYGIFSLKGIELDTYIIQIGMGS